VKKTHIVAADDRLHNGEHARQQPTHFKVCDKSRRYTANTPSAHHSHCTHAAFYPRLAPTPHRVCHT